MLEVVYLVTLKRKSRDSPIQVPYNLGQFLTGVTPCLSNTPILCT